MKSKDFEIRTPFLGVSDPLLVAIFWDGGKSGTGTGTGTGIFRVKAGRGRGQGRFLDGSWDQNKDHREGTKEYFSCRLVVIAILLYYYHFSYI